MKKFSLNLFIVLLFTFFITTYTSVITFASTESNEDSSLNITAKHAIVIDMDTKEVIYSLNSEDKVQIASTTKLMTAILLSENRNKDDVLQMSAAAKALPSSSISRDKLPQMPVGEKITADNVMKGLLLYSGNDMAEIIAENISDSTDDFSKLMNEKADELGMTNSHFYTPNGLDSDSILSGNEHYSTAYDMGLLGIEALKHDWIKNTVSLQTTDFDTMSGLKTQLTNTNKNLNKNGCIGGKTGYTDKAGKCLVGYYKKNNKNLVGVVLGGTSPGFFDDMNKIIDYSSKKSREKLISNNDTLKKTTITFKPSKYTNKEVQYDIPVFIKENVMQYKNEYNNNNTEISIDINENIDSNNLDSNTVIGKVTVKDNIGSTSYDLYTNASTEDFISDNQDYINKINSNIKKIKYAIITIVCIIILLLLWAYKRIQYVKKRRLRAKHSRRMKSAKAKYNKKY